MAGNPLFNALLALIPFKPRVPSIQIHMEQPGGALEAFTFAPQRDITAHELARIMVALVSGMNGAVDLQGWWAEAGPDIWRHFKAEPRQDVFMSGFDQPQQAR